MFVQACSTVHRGAAPWAAPASQAGMLATFANLGARTGRPRRLAAAQGAAPRCAKTCNVILGKASATCATDGTRFNLLGGYCITIRIEYKVKIFFAARERIP